MVVISITAMRITGCPTLAPINREVAAGGEEIILIKDYEST